MSTEKKVIAIIGAAGSIGKATLQTLSAKFGDAVSVRAGVRDPASAKSATLAAIPGVQLVPADMTRPESLVELFRDADAAFVIPPGVFERAELARASIDAAKTAGAKFIALVSVASAELPGTVFGGQFGPVEEHLRATGVPFSILRLPLFVDNNWGNKGSIVSQGKIYGAVHPDRPLAPVVVADAGECAAEILVHPERFANTTFRLASPPYSNAQLAAAFSAALGKPVEYVRVPYAAAKASMLGAGFPEWQVNGILELLTLIDAEARVSTSASDDIRTILGRPATTIEEWTQSVALGFQ